MRIASAIPSSMERGPTASASGCAFQSLATLRRIFSAEAPTFVSVAGKGFANLEHLFGRFDSTIDWARVEIAFRGHGRLTLVLAAGDVRAAVADFYSSEDEDDAQLSPSSKESEVLWVSRLIELFSRDGTLNHDASRTRAAGLLETLRAQERCGGADIVAGAWSYGLKRNRLIRFRLNSPSDSLVGLADLARVFGDVLTGNWSIKIGQRLGVLESIPGLHDPSSTVDIGRPAALEQMDAAIAPVVKPPTPDSGRIPEEAVGEILAFPSSSLASWVTVAWDLLAEAKGAPADSPNTEELLEVSILAKRGKGFEVMLDADLADSELRRLRRDLVRQLGLKLKVIQQE